METIHITVGGVSLRWSDGLSILAQGKTWCSERGFRPGVRTKERKVYFDEAKGDLLPFKTGVGEGFKLQLTDFPGLPSLKLCLLCWVEYSSGDVLCELIPLGDVEGVEDIFWPSPFSFEGEGITALPMMQGCLIPNGWPKAVHPRDNGSFCSRGAYMPWFGQYAPDGGYIAIAETPWDGGYALSCPGSAPVGIHPVWHPSLGKISYTRRMRYIFFPGSCDYNTLCKAYRTHVKAAGKLVTLREKAACNPRVDELIGRPVVHTETYVHIEPTSSYYRPGDPAFNDRLTPFAQTAEALKQLKEKGAPPVVVHLDGWGKRGYDNLHPDHLPPCEAAGGWDGMQALSEACHSLGDFFGTHDQYRDYFFDAETFDAELAVRNADGGLTEHCVWYGGRQTFLCATQAPYYIRRNFDALVQHGILLDNTYLDVFSVVELDECFHPMHLMTRKECAEHRLAGFAEAAARGILVSSEETVDWALPGLVFCHHAPHALDTDWDKGEADGIPVPLFDLVYHDCMLVPWFPTKGGWGIPESMDGRLLAFLHGGGVYLSLDAEQKKIEAVREVAAWQRAVACCEMLSHTFISGTHRQRTLFAGGYAAEVDFATGEYQLTWGTSSSV